MGGEPYGSKRLLRLTADVPSVIRPSVRRGRPAERGAVIGWGLVSMSSASPRYLGRPSMPISTLGAIRKCVRSRYSGLMSREASSGRDDGDRNLPFSTSSTL